MKSYPLLAAALLVSTPTLAAEEARFDLICTPTKAVMMMDGESKVLDITEGERFSIDLASKLWCARRPDRSCGSTIPLVATASELRLKDMIRVDRRSGILTMAGGIGPMTSLREYACTKAAFTPLPKLKF